MDDLDSLDYYRSRERQERALAAAAVSPGIAGIHREMAAHYVSLIKHSVSGRDAQSSTAPRGVLTIVQNAVE